MACIYKSDKHVNRGCITPPHIKDGSALEETIDREESKEQ